MEFGRLAQVDAVDFSLPVESAKNRAVLESMSVARGVETERERVDTFRVFTGAPSWSDRALVGTLYPPGTRPGEFLEAFASQYTAAELNSTYFGVHADRIRRWAASVPEDFRFAPKFPQAISHAEDLRTKTDAIRDFADAIEGFETRGGPAWILLPERFGPERLGEIEHLLSTWPAALPLAIEVRSRAWFLTPARDDLLSLLREHKTPLLLTDVAGRRDVCHGELTSDVFFLRLVGNAHHPSDFTRVDAWADRVAEWARSGLREVHAFFHQLDERLSIELVARFVERLGARLERSYRGPRRVEVWRQGELF